nr:hypothetical protein [Pandoravirus aubagnensis]
MLDRRAQPVAVHRQYRRRDVADTDRVASLFLFVFFFHYCLIVVCLRVEWTPATSVLLFGPEGKETATAQSNGGMEVCASCRQTDEGNKRDLPYPLFLWQHKRHVISLSLSKKKAQKGEPNDPRPTKNPIARFSSMRYMHASDEIYVLSRDSWANTRACVC